MEMPLRTLRQTQPPYLARRAAWLTLLSQPSGPPDFAALQPLVETLRAENPAGA